MEGEVEQLQTDGLVCDEQLLGLEHDTYVLGAYGCIVKGRLEN